MPTPTVQVNIRLTVPDYEELEKLASKAGDSVTGIVTQAITEKIGRAKRAERKP